MSTPVGGFDPQPCCGDGGGGAASDLVATDLVCAESGGFNITVIRQVLFGPDGTELGVTFTSLDGTVIVPDSWTPGECQGGVFTTTGLCLGDGTPIGIVIRRTPEETIVQDGWVNLLSGAFSAGAPPVGTQACGQNLNIQTSDVLCDINTGTGAVLALVLIQYNYNPDGSIASTDIVDATSGAPYVPAGTISVCPTDTGVPDNDMQVLCDRQADGSLVPLIRDYRRDAVGAINGFTDYTLGGAPYVPTGTVQSCIPRIVESVVLCADNGTFIRTYTYTQSGAVSSFSDSTLAGGAFVPSGTVRVCQPAAGDTEVTILCDLAGGNSVPFLRRQTFDASGAVTATADTTPGGAPYVVGGPVASCAAIDTEPQVLCDVSAGGVSTPFLRRYSYAASGLLVGTNDTQLNGSTSYAVTGTVMNCAGRDAESEVLCDSAAVPNQFVRTYTYSAAGVVSGFTDATLAGAPFVPTGAVGRCAVTTSATIAGSTVAATTLTTATTGNGTTVDFGNAKSNVSLFIQVNGTVTAGAVDLQVSQDGTNWARLMFSSPLATGVNQTLGMSGGAYRWFRGVVSDTVTGGGSVTATLMFA